MRRSALGTLMGALAIVLVASSTGPASAQTRQTYDARLTSDRPGTVTGFAQAIRYRNPQDAESKPFAVAEIVFELPEGAIIDTSALPRCEANEAEFQLEGAAACPPSTAVGGGSLSLDFGAGAGPLPRVVVNDVTFFNNEDELILFSQSTNTGEPPVRNASRVEVRGRAFVSRVPPLPAAPPPDPFAAVKDVVNRLGAITGGADSGPRAYITTPPTCPASGQWVITARFTYRDGVVQTAESSTPCRTERAARPDRDEDRGDGRSPGSERPTGGERRAGDVGDDGEDESGDVRAVAPRGASGARLGDGELPFTGLPLGALAGIGAALLASGLALGRVVGRAS